MNLATVEIKMTRATALPVLPHIVTHLLKLTSSSNATMRDYERVIMQDSAIASKVLRVANSSMYGTRSVMTLDKAVSMMGINTVRSISTAVAFQSALTNKNLPKGFLVNEYWQHSLGVACAAKILAIIKKYPQPDEAFIAGLMHDIGKMALALYLPTEANYVYQTMLKQKISQYEAEHNLFDLTHQDIGLLIARKWELPAAYHDCIASHHTPATGEGEINLLTACVHVGNFLAHEAGCYDTPYRSHSDPDPVILSYLDIPEAQFEPLKEVIRKEIRQLSQQYSM